MTSGNRKSRRRIAKTAKAGAFAAAMICPQLAQAFDIDLGNGDVVARWDNTLRYTLGERVQATSRKLLGDANSNDGDANFKSGIVTDRFDLFSEADIVYKKLFGARVSGSFWYDAAYASLKPESIYTPGQFAGNGTPAPGLSNYAQRFYKGPSGELLDAFAFVNPTLGGVSTSLKVGRHAVIWGESLYLGGAINSVSYGQSPLDIAKAFANPGAEAKELFRPIDNISLDVQPSSTLSLSAQYFLQWEPYRFPEAGTYYGMYDPAQFGGQIAYASAVSNANPLLNPYFKRYGDVVPHQLGSWGTSARWSPDMLEGTLGLYYRQFSDMVPQLGITPSTAGATTLLTNRPGVGYPNLGTYNLTYGSDIHLYGVSLAKEVAGISVGSEFNYRTNMPLVSDPGVIVLTGPFAPFTARVPGSTSLVPTTGQTVGARGDTMHAVVNLLGTLPGNMIYDSAVWAGEMAWSHLVAVTRNENVYLGRSYLLGPSDAFRATRDAGTLALSFTPTWFSALPSVDLSAPLSVSWGVFGNSPVALGGNKNVGNFGFGLSALVRQKYTVALQYTGEMGQLRSASNGAVVQNGLGSLLQDRSAVYLTLKTTF